LQNLSWLLQVNKVGGGDFWGGHCKYLLASGPAK